MKNRTKIIFLLLITSFGLFSCEDMFDVKPDEVLLQEDYLGKDRIDARSALFGLLGQMQEASKQYVVLGELRADLMDVTGNSVDELRQINDHNVAKGNSLADPSTLFSIINNCNYALQGLDTVVFDNELLSNYVSILRIRAWANLQAAINYGSIPYFTKPIANVADLNKNYPLLSLNQVVDNLINELVPYETVDNVSTYTNSLNYVVYKLIPDKDILLGDLYLWANNFPMAATSYKLFLDRNVAGGGAKYNLTATYANVYTNAFVPTYKWYTIFDETIVNDEIVNYIPFSLQYRQPNKFYDLITNYQVKPSSAILANWSSQWKYLNGNYFAPGDPRSIVVVLPLLSENNAITTKLKYGNIILARAANIYLKYAEAINRAGYPLHALYILNQGPKNDTTIVEAPRFDINADVYLNFTQNQYYTISSGKSINGNLGIRGRAGVSPAIIENATSKADSIMLLEKIILNESALECAFEGNRWSDLMRISLRNNDPSILANSVAQKFSLGGSSQATSIQSKLMDENNWYLDLENGFNF